jgi:hypothetical protein
MAVTKTFYPRAKRANTILMSNPLQFLEDILFEIRKRVTAKRRAAVLFVRRGVLIELAAFYDPNIREMYESA